MKLKDVKKLLRLARYPIFTRHHKISPNLTFSQTGEDAIISFIFNSLKIKRPSYLDVGAYHPFTFSNTAKFYLNGSTGINIEPNPDAFTLFQRHRKNDINLNIGIAEEKGVLQYFVLDAPTLNTFSKDSAMEMCQKWGRKIVKTIDIEVDTIENIIAKFCGGNFPDFFTLDVEGIDIKLLQAIDYARSSPKVICVETAEYSESGCPDSNQELVGSFLEEHGYMQFANTHINSIFLLKRLWENR